MANQHLSRREVLQAALILPIGSSLAAAETRWRTLAPMPLRVQEIYPCLHNNQIWVAGGLSPDASSPRIGITDQVVRYDLTSGQWLDGPALPEPRHHGFLISLHDELFLFGGFVAANGGGWSASKDVFKLAGDQWEKVAMMPKPQMETVAAIHEGKIHFAGGRAPKGKSNANWGDQTDVVTHQVFDLKTLSTSNAVPLPKARNSAASFVIGDKWHVVGGRTVGGGNSNRHDIYDFSNQRWLRGAPLPQGQGGLAAASVGRSGYVFGGEFFSDGGGVYSEVWQYDANADTWQDAGKMPVPRHGLGAVAVAEDIYVIGGAIEAGGRGTSNRLSVFSGR